MSLQTRITALVQAIAADIKALFAAVAGKLDATGGQITGPLGLQVPAVSNAALRIGPEADTEIGTSWHALMHGNGYSAGISVGSQSMKIGHNASSRHISFHSGGSYTERLRLAYTGEVLAMSGVMGYGFGGTVVQETSKSTTVTLNKPSGRITTHNAELAAGVAVHFSFYNSLITAVNTVNINPTTSSNTNYRYEVAQIINGAALIRITNITAAPRSEALVFNFNVLAGSVS